MGDESGGSPADVEEGAVEVERAMQLETKVKSLARPEDREEDGGGGEEEGQSWWTSFFSCAAPATAFSPLSTRDEPELDPDSPEAAEMRKLQYKLDQLPC